MSQSSGLAALAEALSAIPFCHKLWEIQAEQQFGPRLRALAESEPKVNPKTGLTFAREAEIRAEYYRDADTHDPVTGEFVQMQPNDFTPAQCDVFAAVAKLPRAERLAWIRPLIYALEKDPAFYESLEFKLMYNDLRSKLGLQTEPVSESERVDMQRPKPIRIEEVFIRESSKVR